jgi:hypothetical protein
LPLSGDTPYSGHLVTLRSDRPDQDEKRSLQHITASPGKIGQIARAALVLVLFEHKMLT